MYLIYGFYTEFAKISQNSITTKNWLKIGKIFEYTLDQRRCTDGNKQKGCSTSLVIRKMQFQTAMRYHDTPIRLDKIIKTDHIPNAGKIYGWAGCLLHCLDRIKHGRTILEKFGDVIKC